MTQQFKISVKEETIVVVVETVREAEFYVGLETMCKGEDAQRGITLGEKLSLEKYV